MLFGDGVTLGLATGEGDFLVAAEAMTGPQQARAAMHAVMILNLFFMVGDLMRFRF
jgi:hypothetical protein